MSAIAIDTHAFFNTLKEAGFTEKQAEAITTLQKEAITIAIEQTKHDFELENIVTNKSLDVRIKEVELKIETSKIDIIRWIVTIVIGTGAAQIFAIIGLLKLLGKI